MVFDITQYKSHPDKFLLTQPDGQKGHVNGVIDNVRKLTKSKVAELIAIFHDLGKINPNFQDKLDPFKKATGYSNHAYLSAFAFWAFCHSQQNLEFLKYFLGDTKFTPNDLLSWIILIAKHHGNLPDFDTPDGFNGSSYCAISKDELSTLFNFINCTSLPVSGYTKTFKEFDSIENFEKFFVDEKIQQRMPGKFKFVENEPSIALNFFIDTQFAFSSLIQADKADAAKHENFIDNNRKDVVDFCKGYQQQLSNFISTLDQGTALNQLRTEIREESVDNIQNGLKKGKRVFELTSPTGSGKTLMLLSLASEILKKGNFRVIYALPFLSITEQVEAEVIKIFTGKGKYINRIDSKSENKRFEEIQEELESDPSEDKIQELDLLEFQENTFSYPFVITTFVRFFETLLSNRNAELLKLPNFSNCIFLLDEIQSLPPRLYGFFIAYLSKFCEKVNSYAIVSTATQPNFSIPEKAEIKEFFAKYEVPFPLLSLKFFNNNLFNRYQVHLNNASISMEALKEHIIKENKSVLVILNTIDDTKDLYNSFIEEGYSIDEIFLLNTHFTPKHRKLKIYLAKRRLKQDKRVILISTQLIEAGVDIDFPVLYRDFTIVASIVQSAGRCNRNGKLSEFGRVVLFKLINKGKIRSELIYRGKDKDLLTFTKEIFIQLFYEEKNLLSIQKQFFNLIQNELNFAKHDQNSPKRSFDFLKDIRQAQFEKIGSFRLIDEELFGEERQYYVPKDEGDCKFENLLSYHDELINTLKSGKNDIRKIKSLKIKIANQLKKMANQIIQVRSKKNFEPLKSSDRDYYQLSKISLSSYSFDNGIDLAGLDCII